MRNRHLIAAVICIVGCFVVSNVAHLQALTSPLRMFVTADRSEYVLGEVVRIACELRNISDRDAFVTDVFGVGGGSVQVLISKDGKNFPEYNPGWGQVDFQPSITTIKPNGSITSTAAILWNNKPNALNAESDESIKEIGKRTMITSFAFPEPGTYYLKTVYNKTVESSPITITIREPIGEDASVWALMKNDDRIAYFIQMGYFPDSASESRSREDLMSTIQRIIDRYPNSIYAEPLRQSLITYKANEAKRKEFRESLKKSAN